MIIFSNDPDILLVLVPVKFICCDLWPCSWRISIRLFLYHGQPTIQIRILQNHSQQLFSEVEAEEVDCPRQGTSRQMRTRVPNWCELAIDVHLVSVIVWGKWSEKQIVTIYKIHSVIWEYKPFVTILQHLCLNQLALQLPITWKYRLLALVGLYCVPQSMQGQYMYSTVNHAGLANNAPTYNGLLLRHGSPCL